MNHLKLYEQFRYGREPDLRRMTNIVRCVKRNYEPYFTLNRYYDVKIWGNPQRAIEEFHINDYIPVECVSKIRIKSNRSDSLELDLSKKQDYNFFFDYFELADGKKMKRKQNLEDDPWSEENWGYEEIKENSQNGVISYNTTRHMNDNELLSLLKKKIIGRTIDFHALCETGRGKNIIHYRIKDIRDFYVKDVYIGDGDFIFIEGVGKYDDDKKYEASYILSKTADIFYSLTSEEIEKRRQLTDLHKEEDPWGEENWEIN